MKNILFILGLCLTSQCFSQVITEFGPGGGDRAGSLIFYGSDAFNRKIAYENIKGIRYWKDEYLPAKLYAPANKLYGTYQAKMNIATRELEYIGKGDEVISADPDKLSKVIFIDPKDSTRILSIFRNDLGEVNVHFIKRNKRYYTQELNQGPVKLLKVTERELRIGDSMVSTLKRYYFVDIDDYFIQHENRIEILKKLNKEEVLKYLPHSPALDGWIKEQNIRFNREEDVLRLLEYYNQAAVKKE
jgi:hypothetical protein